MIYQWTPEDIRSGIFYHRGFDLSDENKPQQSAVEYAVSCLHKLGTFHHFDKRLKDNPYNKDENGNRLFFSTTMTDGITYMMGTGEDTARKLTEGKYKRTTKEELILMIETDARCMRLFWE